MYLPEIAVEMLYCLCKHMHFIKFNNIFISYSSNTDYFKNEIMIQINTISNCWKNPKKPVYKLKDKLII